jgi:hypothetical protein
MARFSRKNIKHKVWVFIPSTLLSETFLILRRTRRDTILNLYRPSRKVPVLFPGFNKTWIFSTEFRNILKYQILWKSIQWDSSCSTRTDRWTDKHEADTSRFPHFANAPKMSCNRVRIIIFNFSIKCNCTTALHNIDILHLETYKQKV